MMPAIPTRLPDWHPRLVDYVASVAPSDFRYGSMDCALFAAGAVRAMTGSDPAAAFRGTYVDLRTGLQRLRSAGYESHVGVVDCLFVRIAPAFAQLGDLALIEGPEGPALGIFAGETIACLGPRGLAHATREAGVSAWKVP